MTTAGEFLNAGSSAQRAGAYDVARERYVAALRLDPECVGALNNLSPMLADRRHLMAAVACVRRALALEPGHPRFLGNLGNILVRMGQHEEAVRALAAAIAIEPTEHGYHHSLGLALYPTDAEAAVAAYDGGLAISLGEERIVRDRAIALLACGQWVEGFAGLHGRHDAPRNNLVWMSDIPEWQGQPLNGKRLLVHHEQGFGDTIQFCRMLEAVEGEVIFSVAWQLRRLMTASLPYTLVDVSDPPPDADYHCPMMGAIAQLVKRGEDVFRDGHPYLAAPPGGPRLRRAQSTLMTVGVCWAGAAAYANDFDRSMPFEHVLSIGDIPGVQLFSLQVGDRAGDPRRFGGEALVGDLSALVHDFADLAYVIKQCDLVISVDTAPLHLAGAMGVPALALLPYTRCWRWLRGREDSPFYGGMKLIQQETPGDWTGVMVRVREHLAEMLEKI